MDSIRILFKPDSISWDDLAKCQRLAHKSNIENGVNMKCADYTANDLKVKLKNAITLVALNESDALVGMLSIDFGDVKRWWHKGKAAYICYVAVAPEYKGKGIYRLLSNKADDIVCDRDVNVEYLHTHVDNRIARKAYERDGYKAVRFSPGLGTDYYQIEMAKWLNGKRNKYVCMLVFKFTELITRSLYKPGKKRRF